MTNQQQRPNGCGFCKNNRESPRVFLSHQLRDSLNRLTCPQLRRYVCPHCGGTGDDAHTRSKCPNVANLRHLWRQQHSAEPGPLEFSRPRGPPDHHNHRPQAGEPAHARAPNQHLFGQSCPGAPGPQSRPTSSSSRSSLAGPEDDLVLGFSRVFCNMGRVTNSRFNSAGRLRNRHHLQPQPHALGRPDQHRRTLGAPAEYQLFQPGFDCSFKRHSDRAH